MKEKMLDSWEEFEKESRQTISKAKRERESCDRYLSDPLFRGQSDSVWGLKSTLDRIKEEMRVSEYYRIIRNIHNDIAVNTGKRWISDERVLDEISRSDLLPYDIWCGDESSTEKARFMIYLRHNGFPSPLLDWTQSPYIAGFFAFNDIWGEKKSEYVSIFVYQEYTGHGKGTIVGDPYIHTIGHNIDTDRKHYLQQSEYLICARKKRDKSQYFAKYEDVDKTGVPSGQQDALIKYNIPVSEQTKVLHALQLMNITAFSLFNDETTLMETLGVREFFLSNL